MLSYTHEMVVDDVYGLGYDGSDINSTGLTGLTALVGLSAHDITSFLASHFTHLIIFWSLLGNGDINITGIRHT